MTFRSICCKISIIIIVLISISVKLARTTVAATECESDASFKCYNGGECLQFNANLTSIIRTCRCKPGFTGRHCEQRIMPCMPDPCAPNGYCNTNDTNGYFCRCKPGFTGINCEENINDCLTATCYNGGSCIDGINSYECECKWPYTGRYCLTKMRCDTDLICKNDGICMDDERSGPKCLCPFGFKGVDCSVKVDICQTHSPCRFDGECINTHDDYKCKCKPGRIGKNCEYEDICLNRQPCKNNATCTNLLNHVNSHNHEKMYYCQCAALYTGINCDIKLEEFISIKRNNASTTTTKATSSSKTTNTVAVTTPSSVLNSTLSQADDSNKNGSFVLVVNIRPEEFKQRQNEIVREFEKKFGILMLIKKEAETSNEMIYPFYPNEQDRKQVWTKVYFIIIFACVYDSNSNVVQANRTSSLCLQNNVNNLNDAFEILNQFKKSSQLMPNYVSNISYETYSESLTRTRPTNNDFANRSNNQNNNQVSTTLLVCMAIVFLVSITLVLTVMLRQNAVKRVKAPIWFPPPLNDASNNTLEMKKANNNINQVIESNEWSLTKKFDDFTNMFRTNPKSKTDDMSPPSCIDEEDNDYGEYESKSKMRKLDAPIYTVINHSNSSTCSSKSTNTTTPSLMLFPSTNNPKAHTPDYYPSPPESLPDVLNPINYKSNGLTPLMLFIMNRSKAKHSQNGTKDDLINETEIIDSFILNGADLNTTNLDGETVLHLAARCGLYQIFDRLLKTGMDLNAYDNYGRNVLHTAVCSNEFEIVKLILEHCSNSMSVNQQILDDRLDLIDSKTNDDLGDTALIIASRLNLNTVLKLLIDYNATVNATDNEGRSALHWCAKVNNFNGAMLLLQAGANVNMQDNDERTPLTSALSELCTKEVADLLIKYDAFVSSEDEAKYKKMKSILEQLNMLDVNVQQKLQENFQLVKTANTNTYKENNLLVKSNNLNKVTNVSVSSSTKRKYSESCANENKNNTLNSKKKPVVNKAEPQVINHVQQQQQYSNEYQQHQEYNSYYSNLNSYNNGFNSYQANNMNSYHNQQQQQYNFHHNPAFSYNSSSNDSIEILDGPTYHSEASKMNGYYTNTNTLSNGQIYHHLTNQQQSTQNNNFSNSTNLYFTTNETYAAYF